MGVYLKYIKRYGGFFVVAVTFLFVEAICDLLLPTILAKVIDVGVSNRDLSYIGKMGGIMIVVALIGAISATIRNIIGGNISQGFGAQLRGDLFRRIQRLEFVDMDRLEKASLITRLTNDVNQLQNFVNGSMRILVKAPLMAAGGIFMASRLNPKFSYILYMAVPIVVVLILLNMKISFPFFSKVQLALDRVNGKIREYLTGVRVVKAFHRTKLENERFEGINQELQQETTKALRVMSVFTPVNSLIFNLGIVAALWIGGLGVSDGSVKIGEIMAFINYSLQIIFAVNLVANVFMMFVRFKASSDRVVEVLQIPLETEVPTHTEETQIQFNTLTFSDVSFRYANSEGYVLRDVSFSMNRGELLGVIGSTGSGKTSLIQLILQFYKPEQGKILLDGKDLEELPVAKAREGIAYVPQKNVLFSGTIGENIRFGNKEATEEQVRCASKRALADDFITGLQKGYETVVGQGGVNLSGGQKQRVAIARALVRNPRILILDDSTSALDIKTENRFLEHLKGLSDSIMTILIAQKITSVMKAQQIMVLDKGRVVGLGTHEELLRTNKVYQEIYISQIGEVPTSERR